MTRRADLLVRLILSSISCLLMLQVLAQPVVAQELDDILDKVDDDLTASAKQGQYTIQIVDLDGKPIEDKRFLRGIPGQFSVVEFPHVYAVDGNTLFTAGVQIDSKIPADASGQVRVFTDPDPDMGDSVHYRSKSTANLPPGRYTIQPFNLDFEVGGSIRTLHPALVAEGKTLKIKTVPVTFGGVDAKSGLPVPLAGLQVAFEKTNLLDNLGAQNGSSFNPLTLYLPIGLEYNTTLGSFTIDEQGKIKPIGQSSNFKEGKFVIPVDPQKAAAMEAIGKGYWVSSYNNRRVFKRGETMRLSLIASGEYPAGEAPVVVRHDDKEHVIGQLKLSEVKGVNSQLFFFDTNVLAPGKYEIALKSLDSHPFTFELVEILPRTTMVLQTVSCCNAADFTLDDAGIEQMKIAGVNTWISFGHGSTLGGGAGAPALKDPYVAAVPADAPSQMRQPETNAELILETTLRHGVTMIDYSNRRAGFYNEGLSYHHSYQPSVDRIVRHVQIFAQELEDYPAFTGFSYTWFPALGGYNEGGVPTDPYYGDRLNALNAIVKEKDGVVPITSAEWQLLYAETSKATPEQKRELADHQRKFWRSQQDNGWIGSFSLYNQKLREVRPDFIATTHENSGHDAGKKTSALWGAHDAISYESYTDYGDWHMATPFVIDWARGNLPGKPIWYTIDGTQTDASMVAKAFYALARGADGINVTVASPNGVRRNRTFGKLNSFLAAYGPIVKAYAPDQTIAILTPEIQFANYQAHALNSNLLRIGYASIELSEFAIEKNGIPDTTKVIFIPNQSLPFGGPTEAALKAFIAKGGKVVEIGEKPKFVPEGAILNETPIKTLWDVGGFPFATKFLDHFKEIRPALEKQMADLGLTPVAGASPEKAIILPMSNGGVKYITVVSSPDNKRDVEFYPVEGVQVKVGDAKKVINLVTAKELPIKDGQVTVDLIGEPAAMLVLLQDDPKSVELTAPEQLKAGEAISLSANVAGLVANAKVPLRYTIADAAGQIRATFYRLSNNEESVAYDVPATDAGGAWTVTATELLTGIEAKGTINVAAGSSVNAIAAAPAIYLPHPDRVERFAKDKGEVRVVVEDTQTDVLADANRLVEALNSAGRPAKLLPVNSASYDTYWQHWYPRKLDDRVMAQIDKDEIVGYRGHLNPFIIQAQRSFDPSKGGYTDIQPNFIIRKDVVLFSGGKISESLKVVSDWLDTPHTPGLGNATVEVVLSPFWAGKNALTVVAHDAQGRGKAVEALVAMLADPSKIATNAPFAKPAVAAASHKITGADRSAGGLDAPLLAMVPPAFVKKLEVAADGNAAVTMKDTTVIVAPDGKILTSLASDAVASSIGNGGSYFRTRSEVLQTSPSWHFPTAWRVNVEHIEPAAGAFTKFNLPGEFVRSAGYPKDWENGFAASPDGKTFVAAKLGGGCVLYDLETRQSRIVEPPTTAIGFLDTVRDPVFATSSAFSPDGKFLAYTTGTYPTGYGGMMGPPPSPFATSIRLIDVKAGTIVWQQSVQMLNDSAYAAVNGCIAVSDGGRRVAFIDYRNNAVVLDETGKELSRQPIYYALGKYSYLNMPPPLRAEMSADAKVILFAADGNVVLSDDAGKVQSTFIVPSLCDVHLTRDGQRIYATDLDGNVMAYDAKGQQLWSTPTRGERPKLAISSLGVLVGEGAGNLLLLDAQGKITRTVELAGAKAQAPTFTDATFTGPPTYIEPPTLAILQTQGGAKSVKEWQPAGTEKEAFGKKFHAVSGNIALAVSGEGNYVVHIVYRHTGKGATIRPDGLPPIPGNGPSVMLDRDGKTKTTFVLDLPTPEYRVVDLPATVESSLTVNITPAESMEIAELAIYSFNWPGNNGAFIASATDQGNHSGLETKEEVDPVDVSTEVLDDSDPTAVAKAASGKMKNVKIYSHNTDPDQVEGSFFRNTGNGMDSFDGQRFAEGKPSTWTAWFVGGQYTSFMGTRILIDLGYVSHPKWCVTYARPTQPGKSELRQSDVMDGIAVVKGAKENFADPDGLVQRNTLNGVLHNDQFFNIFPLDGKTPMNALCVYVFGEGKEQGLSEVELYE